MYTGRWPLAVAVACQWRDTFSVVGQSSGFTCATRQASQVVLAVVAEHDGKPREAGERAGQVGETWQVECHHIRDNAAGLK